VKSNEKLTQRAELAIEQARAAAGEMGHAYVGTEHLLLGVLREKKGLGARILEKRGISEDALHRIVVHRSGIGSPGAPAQGLSQRARAAVERAAQPHHMAIQVPLRPRPIGIART